MPATKKIIPIAGPWITEAEVQAVTKAAREEWYDKANHSIQAFEKAFAEQVNRSFAIALPSCTAGLHLALLALGIGPGDEVIVPDCTWIATSAPIHYVGATPVFADIDPITWCLDTESLVRAITPRTKAIIPVDLYGGMPDWSSVLAVAKAHALFVIEDAAEAVGASYHGKPAGSFGDVSVFSFHGSKTLSCGEGGMLVTDNPDMHQKILFLRDHGRVPGDTEFFNEQVAFKYKMGNLQAALGLAQLKRLPELIARKRDLFAEYQAQLGEMACIQWNAEPENTHNSYWMVTALLEPGVDVRALRQKLQDSGIATRPFFHPLSSLPAYRDVHSVKNPNAYHIAPRGLNLPSALTLSTADVQTVCGVLRTLISS